MHPVRLTGPLVLVVAAIAAAMGCQNRGNTPRDFSAAMSVDSLECPNHRAGLPGGDTAALPIAGAITTVAEFHDCQRLVDPGDTASYSVLAGIWVSEVLDSLPEELRTLNPSLSPATLRQKWMDEHPNDTMPGLRDPAQQKEPPPPAPIGTGLTFALLYAWNGPYSALGIAQGWNCLVLFPAFSQSGYSAVVAPVRDPRDCVGSQDSTLQGDTLWVHNHGNGGLGRGHVPPVGRWDRDPVSGEQYMGLACGDDWCEVTRTKHYVSSPRYGLGSSAPKRDRAVFAIKGWYDEQPLAIRPAGNPNGPLVPAPFMGTIVPSAALDTMSVAWFTKKWVPAARISLTSASHVYQAKYGLSQGQPPHGSPAMKMATFEVCRGMSNRDCSVPESQDCSAGTQPDGYMWFWRITPIQGDRRYGCIDRHDHSGLGRHIPGTARWRWVKEDEKLWVRCGEGCCPAN